MPGQRYKDRAWGPSTGRCLFHRDSCCSATEASSARHHLLRLPRQARAQLHGEAHHLSFAKDDLDQTECGGQSVTCQLLVCIIQSHHTSKPANANPPRSDCTRCPLTASVPTFPREGRREGRTLLYVSLTNISSNHQPCRNCDTVFIRRTCVVTPLERQWPPQKTAHTHPLRDRTGPW